MTVVITGTLPTLSRGAGDGADRGAAAGASRAASPRPPPSSSSATTQEQAGEGQAARRRDDRRGGARCEPNAARRRDCRPGARSSSTHRTTTAMSAMTDRSRQKRHARGHAATPLAALRTALYARRRPAAAALPPGSRLRRRRGAVRGVPRLAPRSGEPAPGVARRRAIPAARRPSSSARPAGARSRSARCDEPSPRSTPRTGARPIRRSGMEQPGCHLTTGHVRRLLRPLADAPLAVMEVECRSRRRRSAAASCSAAPT